MEEGEVPTEVKKEARRGVDYLPDLFTHELFLTSLGLFILVISIAIFGYTAPLEHIANPQVTPLDTKAPWYFWWLQGMLKLGDKSLMGIILPTIMVGLLLAVPYIDRNPHRSLYKRPLAVAVGLLAVLVLVVLSYMGTPQYRIQTPAATRIIQDLAPEEGVGPIREIPFDQLQPGAYQVNVTPAETMCPNLDFGCPVLEEVFAEFSARVNEAAEQGALPEVEAVMTVEDWQKDLKKITPRIVWTDEGQRKAYERHIFVHRDHLGE
jgi:hypothetical protein